MIDVFSYLEYRDFLKDHFHESKNCKKFYSFRYVASKTGIDASFYVRIINKQKHIGESKIETLADFLELNERQKEYFYTLVLFNRATNDQVAKDLFSKLMSLKTSFGREILNFRYFAEWYIIPMREFLNYYSFDGDYEKLGLQFIPSISENEARNAVKTLVELNLIKEDDKGFLRPCDTLLTTGDQWKSIAISNFQKAMINLGKEAIDRFEPDLRDISTVTVSTSQECMAAISERLAQARKEILEMIAVEKSVDGVYQINLQVFPLTKGNSNHE